jgi:aspartate beta-hydroxylase
LGKARALDAISEIEKNNRLLIEAISLYTSLIENHNDQLSQEVFQTIGERCIDRLRFLGQYESAVKIHEYLIRRIDDGPQYRNELAITYLLMDR